MDYFQPKKQQMTLLEDLRDYVEVNPIDLTCSFRFIEGLMHLKVESLLHLPRLDEADIATAVSQGRSLALLFYVCIFGTACTLIMTYFFFKKRVLADLIQVMVGEGQTRADVNELSLSLNLNLNFDKAPKSNQANTLSNKAHALKPAVASRKG